MTDTTATSGGAPAPSTTSTTTGTQTTAAPAPRSDAEAAAQADEAQRRQAQEGQQPPAQPGKKPNRTTEYIGRLTADRDSAREENRDLRTRLDALEKRLPAPREDVEPTLESCGWDDAKFNAEHRTWAIKQAQAELSKGQQEQAAAQKQRDAIHAYVTRANAFAAAHPDFVEVVESMAFVPPPEIQAAIQAHEMGPDIAYHLGNNDDDAFTLANVRPELAAAAVDRLAARLKAAPPPQQTTETPAPAQADTAALAAVTPSTTTPKTTTAPPPAPTVGGRSPVETPTEKLTDDEWYKRDQERRRKR